MAINLNNTTPAAPTGSTNVTWQEDVSGNVSAYVTTSAELTGSNIDLTAQGANIGSTNLVASPVAGLYRISAYLIVTRAATTSSTLPSLTIGWTDQNSGVAQTLVLTPTNSGNLTTTYQQATGFISTNTSAITYSTASFASSGGTSMQYALHIRVEKV